MVQESRIRQLTKRLKMSIGGGENVISIAPGSIWTSEESEYLIIAVDTEKEYATVLRLMDIDRGGMKQLISKAIKYYDPKRIQYLFWSRLNDFVRLLRDEEFWEVKNNVANALDIPMDTGISTGIIASGSVQQAENSQGLREIGMEEALKMSKTMKVYMMQPLVSSTTADDLCNSSGFVIREA